MKYAIYGNAIENLWREEWPYWGNEDDPALFHTMAAASQKMISLAAPNCQVVGFKPGPKREVVPLTGTVDHDTLDCYTVRYVGWDHPEETTYLAYDEDPLNIHYVVDACLDSPYSEFFSSISQVVEALVENDNLPIGDNFNRPPGEFVGLRVTDAEPEIIFF